MKLIFYPREIEPFNNGEYDFGTRKNCITLLARNKWHYRTFENRSELIQYLSVKGIKGAEPFYPVRINKHIETVFGITMTHSVTQRGMIYGWVQEFPAAR